MKLIHTPFQIVWTDKSFIIFYPQNKHLKYLNKLWLSLWNLIIMSVSNLDIFP